MRIVTVRRQHEYGIPQLCCACGCPPGDGTLTVSGGSVSARRSGLVKLRFPLCDRCASVYRAVNRRRDVGLAIGLGVSALLCGAAFVIPSALTALDSNRLAFFSEILLVLAGLALAGGLVFRELTAKAGAASTAEGGRYPLVSRAVRIRHIESVYTRALRRGEFISLEFGNDEFARLFRRMNAAVVWTDKK